MDWQTELTNKGYRVSEPRKRIMGLLKCQERPLNPLEIHSALAQSRQNLGLASVYRNLALLAKLGLVVMVFQPDGDVGYLARSGGHHHHIVCHSCHRAVEFSGLEDLSALIERVEQDSGYKVDDHLLQFFGVCPQCDAKEQLS